MPTLTTLTSKSIKLEALRTVRSQTSKKYKELKKQQTQIAVLLHSMSPSHQRGMGLANMVEGDNNHNNYSENANHG